MPAHPEIATLTKVFGGGGGGGDLNQNCRYSFFKKQRYLNIILFLRQFAKNWPCKTAKIVRNSTSPLGLKFYIC
jgi:hypothetical protein